MKKIIKQVIGENTIRLIKSFFPSKEEKRLIKEREKFYSQFFSTNNDIFFDVGANYGNRIEPLINKKLKIIAIEPQPECIDFLKRKYKNKITIVEKGLGDKEEVKIMYIANFNTISSFSKEWIDATRSSGRFGECSWAQKKEFKMTTLDALIGLYGKPKFIKIDVEGFEYEVLKGLSHSIDFISFEYTIPEQKKSILDCIDRIVEIFGDNKVVFNYSVGESVEWYLEEWVSPKKMKEEIELERFIKSSFGDIYSKLIS